MMLWYAPQTFLTAMVYDGVFMRHPELRGGVIGSGAGWVPDFLRQLDLAHKSFGRTDPYLKELDMIHKIEPSNFRRKFFLSSIRIAWLSLMTTSRSNVPLNDIHSS